MFRKTASEFLFAFSRLSTVKLPSSAMMAEKFLSEPATDSRLHKSPILQLSAEKFRQNFKSQSGLYTLEAASILHMCRIVQ